MNARQLAKILARLEEHQTYLFNSTEEGRKPDYGIRLHNITIAVCDAKAALSRLNVEITNE